MSDILREALKDAVAETEAYKNSRHFFKNRLLDVLRELAIADALMDNDANKEIMKLIIDALLMEREELDNALWEIQHANDEVGQTESEKDKNLKTRSSG